MEFCNGLAHLAEGRGGCLDHQNPFASFSHLALPAVDGCDLRDDIDAGGKAVLYQMARDFPGCFFRSGGGEDHSFVGHNRIGCQLSAISGQPTTDS